MKKLVLAGVLGCCCMVSADCDVSGKEAYAGLNVGAGLNYVHSKADVDVTICDGASATRLVSEKLSKGRVGGYVELGYGNFISDWYIGGNVVVDINKKNKQSCEADGLFADVEHDGVVPSVALKIGRYFETVDAVAFAEFGLFKNFCRCGASAAVIDTNISKVSNKRFLPVVGLGFEKIVDRNIAVKASLNYRIASSKSGYVGGDSAHNDDYFGCVQNKGYVVRVGCVYHF